jgi:hypothetical protein
MPCSPCNHSPFTMSLLPVPYFWLFVLALFLNTHVVFALKNITVDDTDSTHIVYFDSLNWQRSNQNNYDYGGSHMVSYDSSATAVFTFKGLWLHL